MPKRTGARTIRRPPLHDTIVSALREMIQTSELAPGAKINETALCREFAVSRTPLREALKVLGSEGLVELRPNRGAIVTPIDRSEIGHIYQLMESLEQLAGQLAATEMSHERLDELETLHAQLNARHAAGDRGGYFQINRQIHARIVAFAGNPVLESTYAMCTPKIVRARSLVNYDAKRWQESLAEHEAVMAAFRARDPKLAAERLANHTRNTGRAALNALRQTLPREPESGARRRAG